jgi:hypothetical protein
LYKGYRIEKYGKIFVEIKVQVGKPNKRNGARFRAGLANMRTSVT